MTLTLPSAADLATNYIRDLIRTGKIGAGTKVNIDDLATEMRISATPIREALKRLEGEGLVEIVARVGVYVRTIPVSEILEVYAIRQSLDPLLMYWATERGTDEQIAEFIAATEDLIAHVDQVDEYVDLIERRREALLTMAGSEVLRACLRSIDGRVRWLRFQNVAQAQRMQTAIQEHRDMIDAVRSRNAERAAELAAAHVQSATRSLAAIIGEQASVAPAPSLHWRDAQRLMSTITA